MEMLKRAITPRVEQALRDTPVVVINGARQVGKTTLVRSLRYTERPTLSHFRDRGGAGVDLVLEHPDGRVVGVEVKATSTPPSTDLRGLRFLEDRLGERFHFGVLLTAAPEATPFGPTIAPLPVSALRA